MIASFDEIEAGLRLAGVIANGAVEVVALKPEGETSAVLTYEDIDGNLVSTEESDLTRRVEAGLSLEEIAELHQRSPQSVARRIKRLRLRLGDGP